jgi:hypothetical protein
MLTISAPASPYRHRDPNDPELTDACRVLRPAVRDDTGAERTVARGPPGQSCSAATHLARVRCAEYPDVAQSPRPGNSGRRGHETACWSPLMFGCRRRGANSSGIADAGNGDSGLANGGPSTSGALNALSGAGIANFASF